MRNNRPSSLSGIRVDIVDGQFEKALRKFKKRVAESGILQELREREHYEKPTTKRKRAKAQARKRWLKKLAKGEVPERKY
jgi:small subunit ribosomal protein S21